MKNTSRAIVWLLIAGAGLVALPATNFSFASDASAPEMLQKTYRRRCTNYKCKQVSESTKPIFPCPFCGSSMVPVK